MTFFPLLLLSAAAIAAGWLPVLGLVHERDRPHRLRSLLAWSAKGLLLPILLWSLMNLGLSWRLQPFMPQVQAAQNAGPWFAVYLRVLAVGLFIVCSYWSALTLAWALVEAGRDAEPHNRPRFRALCKTCFLGMLLPALLLLYLGGWTLLGLAGIALFAPMAAYGAPILRVPKTPPMYARAIARLKFGKYSEAEWEIIRQLEKSEDDFDGWMMLADLYANHFHDLPEAERTVLELCDHPKTSPSQLAVALHRLADWRLHLAADPAAARDVLQLICDRLPGTHLAHMARLRINQLPPTPQALRDQLRGERIPLPALGDSIDHEPAPAQPPLQRHQAAEAANACVETLKLDPNNPQARERLARLFAEPLGQPDQAIAQISLLLDLPDQPDSRRAEWLALIAAWHLKLRHDPTAARQVLERVLRDFPHTPQALAARRRLQLLDAQATNNAGPPG